LLVVEEPQSDVLEGFDDWEAYDPERDEAPADYGFPGSCTGEDEEGA
jgi:hypothetical protein